MQLNWPGRDREMSCVKISWSRRKPLNLTLIEERALGKSSRGIGLNEGIPRACRTGLGKKAVSTTNIIY